MSYISGHYRKGHFRNGKWVSGGYVKGSNEKGIKDYFNNKLYGKERKYDLDWI
jgi:hypothetical protein